MALDVDRHHVTQPYGHRDFLRLAVDSFPELAKEFKEAEYPYLQMHAFARLVQQAKKEADWPSYQRAMNLAHELWRRPDNTLHNELNVAFFEHIDFEGPNGPAAWPLLSPELLDGWRAMRAANDRLAARPTKAKKVKPRRNDR